MDVDIIITKIDESYIKVSCERDISMELYDHFSFYADNYRFHRLYKTGVWNGKIYLYSYKTHLIYYGLVDEVIKFANNRNYSIIIDDNIKNKNTITLKELEDFSKTIHLTKIPRDYQYAATLQALNNHKILIQSNTSSGKSLIIYLIIKYLQEHFNYKGLLIVPSINLVSQMFTDFIEYGYDSEKYCHKIYSGRDKYTSKFLTISTYQSLATLSAQYFSKFDFLIVDEAHQGETKSITHIVSSCTNAKYRIGTTGTLKNTKINTLTLTGLFGNIYEATTIKSLIENKYITDFRIKCVILSYPLEIRKTLTTLNYASELNYIVNNPRRNNFIKNLAISTQGTTLILFQRIEQGKILYEALKNNTKHDKMIYFIYGEIPVDKREEIRNKCLNNDNIILVASYGVYATGTNIPSIKNIIFASPSKSRIRVLQSIGRMLRLAKNKNISTLYDIIDDLRYKKHTNITLQHYMERLAIYNEEKFNYKQYNAELKYHD